MSRLSGALLVVVGLIIPTGGVWWLITSGHLGQGGGPKAFAGVVVTGLLCILVGIAFLIARRKSRERERVPSAPNGPRFGKEAGEHRRSDGPRFFSAVEDGFEGLIPKSIPQPGDRVICDLLRGWSGLELGARIAASNSLSEWQHTTLLGFSDRMASIAVREASEEAIYLGLLALGVDDWRFDFRDSLIRAALHYDAAKRVGVEPASVFERAAAVLPPRSAAGLRRFLLRNSQDATLQAFGRTAGEDEGGFRYLSDRPSDRASRGGEQDDRTIRSQAVLAAVQIAIQHGNVVKHVSVSPFFRQYQTVWMADPLTDEVGAAIVAAQLGLAHEQGPTDDDFKSRSDNAQVTFPRPSAEYRRYWGSVG
jgi:hypothetical protein